jgi:predicted nucleotidyltransferase component of viral defense system
LYQRTKGRDLFDLWLLATEVGLNAESVLHAFPNYRPDDFSSKIAIENLGKKLLDDKFVTDIDNLVSASRIVYSVEEAASFIIEHYLQHL